MEYAGFWRRAIAILIDTIIAFIVFTILSFFTDLSFFVENLVYQIGMALFWIYFMSSKHQATPGKMAMGVKVGNTDGSRLSVGKAIGRYFVWAIPAWPLVLMTSTPKFSALQLRMEEIAESAPEQFENFMQSPDTVAYFTTIGFGAIFLIIASIIWCLPAAFTKEKTGIHDRICKTRVFKK